MTSAPPLAQPPAPPPPPPLAYKLRPFNPQSTDLSAIATISALGNEHDELGRYMRRDVRKYWTSYRASNLRYPRGQLAGLPPKGGCRLCVVVECVATHEVVGWAMWSRTVSDSTTVPEGSAAWQSESQQTWWERGCKALERRLLALEDAYFNYVPNADPTAAHAHIRNLMPVLGEGWPKDIFQDFWTLEACYTHPAHYRRGVGGMLAGWGVERGREEGVPVVVHSSHMARRMYERVGFRVIKRMDGFDTLIPEYVEDLKSMGEDEARGAWILCWQPDGTDFWERARRKVEDGTWDGGK